MTTYWTDPETGVRVFAPTWGDGEPYDSSDAYDFTQCEDAMRDGDVVIAKDGEQHLTAVLVEVWPTAFEGIDEDLNAGEFHVLEHVTQWDALDNGKYRKSLQAYERYVAREPGNVTTI